MAVNVESGKRARTATVEFVDVTRRYGKRIALYRASFTVAEGTVLGLLGPNGAGKTTLLSLLCGLAAPDGGAVRWFGAQEKVPLPKSLRRRLGVLTQETALYDELTVRQNLKFAAELYRVPNPARAAEEAAALLSVSHRLDDAVRQLSGGNQRRVAIARSLIHDPDLVIMDEPTLGVDIETRHAIWNHVRRLRTRGKTVVVSTNHLDEAQALCDQILLLNEGRIMEHGTPEEILARTGRCVELDCDSGEVRPLIDELTAMSMVERVGVGEAGLTVQLVAGAEPDPIVEAALQAGGVSGFRVRAPDLLEVFQALTRGPRV
jgi:ABC-2 type transport system ATP-binding protein